MTCCRPNGFVSQDKARVLGFLSVLPDFPDDARIFGPRDDELWRAVNRQGGDLDVWSRHELAEVAQGTPYLIYTDNGVEVHAEGCDGRQCRA